MTPAWYLSAALIVILIASVVLVVATAGRTRKSRKHHHSSSSSGAGMDCDQWVDPACLSFDVDPIAIAIAPPVDVESLMQDVGAGDDSTRQAIVGGAAISGLKTVSTTLPEAEEHIASNPASVTGQQWLAAVSDFSLRGGFNTTKYAYSLNGGNTWSQHFVPLDAGTSKPNTSDGRIWDANSDPVCAFSASGNIAYTASLYFNATNRANGIYVASAVLPSTSGPTIYATSQVRPVIVNTSPSTTNFEDKEWIAADPVAPSTVYISWTHFTATTDYILFSKSTNAGVTWSAPIQVSPGAFNGGVQGSAVAADGHGNVWVVWTTFYVGGIRRIWASKSTNSGNSFSTIGLAVSPYFYALTFPSAYRKEAFAGLSVERSSGTVHVAFPATSNNGTSKVLYTRSINGSGVFTSPVNLINVAAGNQFFPATATDPATPGLVQISWFDSRNNILTNNRQLDVYSVRSLNAGASFAANQRVTPTSTNVGSVSFIGDYIGVAAQGGKALPVFAFLVTPLQTAIIT